jgi:1-phosphofructokinase family hexose kinase
MIATVTLNPAFDRTVYVKGLMPGDTNRILRTELDAGGKGVNASRMLAELGTKTVALGFVGGRAGRFIQHVLSEEGIDTDFVRTEAETRTNIDIEDHAGNPPTTLNERGGPITAEELDRLRDRIRLWARKSEMIILGGSIPQGIEPTVYAELVEIIQSEGSRAVLDADNEPLIYGIGARPMMIKPNIAEASRLVGAELDGPCDAARAARELVGRGVELVVVSMGKRGAVAANASECWYVVPPKVQAQSSVGSGDSMVAGITSAIASRKPLVEALALGAAAGAATAMSSGAEMGKREDINRLLPNVTMERID